MINVKCYDDVTYSFQQGINFISGLNGAGKSTIIEAIGFALFDNIDYTAKQFIREGQKSGQVEILLEANDERLYRIIRKFNTTALSLKWEVYDEASGAMLEQLHGIKDVTNWIKHNIGLAPEDSLRDLYRQVISVQQGAFTTPFLETPSQRRDTFEAILGVEGYRQVYNKTSSLNAEFNGPIAKLETEIAHLQEQVVKLPIIEEQIKEITEQKGKKAEELEKISNQHQEQQKLVNHLALLKDQVEAIKQKIILDQQSLVHYEEQLKGIMGDLQGAEAAATLVQQATPGYHLYQKKQQELTKLESKQVEQRKLQSELDLAEKQQAIAQTEYQSKQEELTKRKAQLLSKKSQLSDELKLGQEKLDKARQDYQKVVNYQAEIKHDLASLQKIIDWFKGNELLLEQAERSQVLLSEHLSQLANLKNQSEELANWSKELADKEQLIQLETVLEAKAKLIGSRDSLLQNRHALEQGICPIIQEACPSTKVAGNLSNYYHKQITKLTKEIELAEQAEAHQRLLQDKINALKLKIEKAKGTEQTRQDLAQKSNDLTLAFQEVATSLDQDLLADLVNETINILNHINQKNKTFFKFAEQVFANPNLPAITEIPEIEWSILVPVQDHHQVTKWLDKFKRQKQELSYWVRDQLGFGNSLQEWLTQILNQAENRVQLAQQGNHHCKTQILEHDQQLNSLAEAEKDLAKQAIEIQTKADHVKKLQAKVEEYADLDTAIANIKQAVLENQSHYEQYKENMTMATRLPGLHQQLKDSQGKQRELKNKLTEQQASLIKLENEYDPKKHQQLEVGLQELLLSKRTLDLELKQLTRDLTNLMEELEQLQAAQQVLANKQEELDILYEARKLLQLIRQVLQAAADPIAQRYRSHISTLASQIYRSIASDNVMLEWADQYEVVLKDNLAGFERERVFKQLSGGEQMTAALAIRLALMQTFSDVGVGFFDEPTANLDVERRESLGFAIQKSVEQFNQLFVISHDDTFDAVTEHTILVK